MSDTRTPLIAGNWKMNLLRNQGEELVKAIIEQADCSRCELAFAPPFPYLVNLREIISAHPGVYLAAQNCHGEDKGAYTGEVAPGMLVDCGVHFVILGHSERRALFGETDKTINSKIKAAIRHGLAPILCCGENLSQREKGDHEKVVARQIAAALDNIPEDELPKLVIAYEPVWAIGTGLTASPQQAQDMHLFIRNELKRHYSTTLSTNTRILYGGSVKPSNAAELLICPDIDGALVGGASLKAGDFSGIVNAVK